MHSYVFIYLFCFKLIPSIGFIWLKEFALTLYFGLLCIPGTRAKGQHAVRTLNNKLIYKLLFSRKTR